MANKPRMVLLLATVLAICHGAQAFYTVDTVAREGEPFSSEVAKFYDWPEGVLTLVNDPLRTNGTRRFFSELPNDVVQFSFRLEKREDVGHLIQQLAQIHATTITIVLAPGDGPQIGAGKTTPGASFAIGNQKTLNEWFLNEWFKRLEEPRPGVRKFGIHTLTEAPTALPPTLSLYLDNPFVSLKNLTIPAFVTVQVQQAWAWDAASQKWLPPPDEVLRFVEAHRAKLAARWDREGVRADSRATTGSAPSAADPFKSEVPLKENLNAGDFAKALLGRWTSVYAHPGGNILQEAEFRADGTATVVVVRAGTKRTVEGRYQVAFDREPAAGRVTLARITIGGGGKDMVLSPVSFDLHNGVFVGTGLVLRVDQEPYGALKRMPRPDARSGGSQPVASAGGATSGTRHP